MLKRRIIQLFIAGMVMCSARAQGQPMLRTFDLGMGYSHLRMLDRQVTPLIYRSHIAPLTVGYSSIGDHIFQLEFGLAVGAHRAVDFKHREVVRRFPNGDGELDEEIYEIGNLPIILQNFNVSYLWKLNGTRPKLSLYAGGSVEESFLISFVPTAIFVVNDLTLNPSIQGFYQLKDESRLSLKVTTALTGLMVRLPYANDPADGKHGSFASVYTMGTDWVTPLNYQRINFDLGYHRPFLNKWNVSAHYKFYWLHYDPKRSVTAYNNEIKVIFSKRLKDK